jgi:SM-20-related protein
MLKLDTLRATPLQRDPFEYLIVRDFIEREKLKQVLSDYPDVPGPGSHPPAGLKIAGHFKEMIDELLATSFRQAVEEKFDIDLTGRPTMYTVRGFCRARDGKIHTDSKTKIITVLLYMNDDSWESSTGRLRILRNGTDLEN